MPILNAGISCDLGFKAPSRLHCSSLGDLESLLATGRMEEVQRYMDDTHEKTHSEPRLLVCHDYKHGYKDDPLAPSFTFNWWPFCDVLVYFAHERITTPPPGWINAAHRNGSKVLGTLIFERDAHGECLNLIIGSKPSTHSVPSAISPSISDLRLSAHYASALAQLADDRGFDGWLLNFECSLTHAEEEARVLSAWIRLLKHELKKRVGPHAEVIWYDSVTVHGKLAWQSRLSSLNLPYFLSADSIFLDYHWKVDYPDLSGQLYDELDHALKSSKTRRDILFGVDVWGRGCHGGGGFNSYKAMEHIEPDIKSLSVALFGPAWTWESKESEPGRSWAKWWQDEVRLWVGSTGPPPRDLAKADIDPTASTATDPAQDKAAETPLCTHGPFRPISAFFTGRPQRVANTPFYTTFSPGIGTSWFVEGTKVFSSATGWTDVDKQTSIGDWLWPAPTFVFPEKGWVTGVEGSESNFNFQDGWLGGSCLSITVPPAACFTAPASSTPNGTTVSETQSSIPIQSLILCRHTTYHIRLVIKASDDPSLQLWPTVLASRSRDGIMGKERRSLKNGWSEVCAQFAVPSEEDYPCVLGVEVQWKKGMVPTSSVQILVGLLSVCRSSQSAPTPIASGLSWEPHSSKANLTTSVSGRLKWDVSAKLRDMLAVESASNITSLEDTKATWFNIDLLTASHSSAWIPAFSYHNVYVLPHLDSSTELSPEDATFIATTGMDGYVNSLVLQDLQQPPTTSRREEMNSIRVYVQGVTDKGEVVPWSNAPFTDIQTNITSI